MTTSLRWNVASPPKVTPVDFCPLSVRLSVRLSSAGLSGPSQKAPGEQREQLVSLVWLKEKQRGNHFMTPARPIKDAEGLRGAGEAKPLRWGPGCTAPGAADCLCREDLRLTIPGAVMMESGVEVGVPGGGQKKTKHEVVKGQ